MKYICTNKKTKNMKKVLFHTGRGGRFYNSGYTTAEDVIESFNPEYYGISVFSNEDEENPEIRLENGKVVCTTDDLDSDNEFSEWVIDDCGLLEPPQKELENLFRDKYKDFLIKNTRQIYFSLDRNRYIDISKAMEIEDDLAFYQWLGIPLDLAGRLQHTIHSDSIEFFDFDYEPFSKEESIILEQAEDKFSNHCQDILNRIESGIDYMFSDEAIIEDIQANNIEFTEEGEI